MTKSYHKLFTGSPTEVIHLQSLLAEKDIVPVIKDRGESARLAGFGSLINDQEVWVHQVELEIAEQILKTLVS